MAGDAPNSALSDVLKASGIVEVGPRLDLDAISRDLPAARLIQFNEPLADDEFHAGRPAYR